MTKIIPVIMSGGAGSRLWPLSRKANPKQLLPLVTNETMVQETVRRFSDDIFADPVFLCNSLHVDAIKEQMQAINRKVDAFIVEPVGRNTAPCAVVAAIHGAKTAGHLVMLVPADHHVTKPDAFQGAIKSALQAARDGYLVTFGIEPDGPETGYGYIARGKAIGGGGPKGIFEVTAFREKPDLETAKAYLSEGGYYWNGGIFLFSPETFLSESAKFSKEILSIATKAYEVSKRSGNIVSLDEAVFASCPSESIDYAIMEHTSKAAVVPCDIGWNDIGSFTSLQAARAKIESDYSGNAINGEVILEGSENCLVQTDGLPVSIVGLSGIGVIVHEGEVMVVNLEKAQAVKNVVNRLKSIGGYHRL